MGRKAHNKRKIKNLQIRKHKIIERKIAQSKPPKNPDVITKIVEKNMIHETKTQVPRPLRQLPTIITSKPNTIQPHAILNVEAIKNEKIKKSNRKNGEK